MNILGKSLTELITLIDNKKISSQEIYNFFLLRSKKYNNILNCYINIINKPKYFDAQNNILKNIPFAIKDNFCTKNIKTTASSKVLDTYIPPYNATVVKRLYEANSCLLAKTNLDAWGHGSSTEASDYGVVTNPYNKLHVAGGSSGGSTAAVCAYLAPFAIGTETAGSIRQPSAWCGVIGLKPSYGRVSRYGVIAMGSSWDCPGPITRTVKDAALVLKIIAGKDYYDGTSVNKPVPNFPQEIKQKRLFNIGIADDYFDNVSSPIKTKIWSCLNILKKMGHKIKRVKLLHPKYAISVYMILQRSEVSSNLARYDGIRFGKDRTYFGEEAKRRILLGTYSLSHGYYDQYYKKAQKVRKMIINDFNQVFKQVDLIISPTTPISATKIGDWKKYPFYGEKMDILCEPMAAAGIPAINLPVGLDNHGLPIGMSIIGKYFDESSILNLAYQFENETNLFGMPKIPKEYQ